MQIEPYDPSKPRIVELPEKLLHAILYLQKTYTEPVPGLPILRYTDDGAGEAVCLMLTLTP